MKGAEKIAFIGAGNMGGAIIRGLMKAGKGKTRRILACDVDENRLAELALELKVNVTSDVRQAVEWCDILVLAVKPQALGDVMEQIGDIGAKTALSIVAGATIARIREGLGGKAKVVRSMPNTPALVGAGIAAVCPGPGVSEADLKAARGILDAVGETVVITKEELLNAVTGLSGSGPAYIFLVIEALADAGVMMGLDRATALKLAAHTTFGSAKLLIETGKHPAELKDMVTSPGGTTAAGLRKLEKKGLRGALIEAVREATKRSEELGKG
jgi:pyrroline-5-carboxylate reductase